MVNKNMKMQILSLLFISVSLNCFFSNWFSMSPQQRQQKVVAIEMYDPINFKECAMQLFNATKDPNVVGVILMVNSSGGSTGDFSVLHDMIKKLASMKPVVCLVMGRAYSGGYLIASAANVVLAHSVSGIGSIGVERHVDRYNNVHIKDGQIRADLKAELFKAGEFKDLGNPFSSDLNENQRSFIQAELMKKYSSFITFVAHNRHLQKDDYKTWAEGKDFDASEALELGLIDEIGTIFDAEERIKELIVRRNPNGGSTDDIEFVYPDAPECRHDS